MSISIQAKDFSGVKVPESFSFLQGSFLSCWLVFTWFTWFFEHHAQKLAGALRYGRFGECHGAWLVAGGPQDHLVPWRTLCGESRWCNCHVLFFFNGGPSLHLSRVAG